jgi:hypothetical protein
MRTFKFYKDEYGWFVELPEWTGEKWDLQMVMGADMFLDILSQGDDKVFVTLSVTPFEGCDVLDMKYLGRLEGPEYGEGAWYELKNYIGIEYNLEMWLCDVTKFVFGNFPKKIYFR